MSLSHYSSWGKKTLSKLTTVQLQVVQDTLRSDLLDVRLQLHGFQEDIDAVEREHVDRCEKEAFITSEIAKFRRASVGKYENNSKLDEIGKI